MSRSLVTYRPGLVTGVLSIALLAVSAEPAAPQAGAVVDSVMRPLAFLAGSWMADPSTPGLPDQVRNLVIAEFTPIVGGKAIRVREHVPPDRPDEAELQGMIYWDPARERIQFFAVAGKGDGQGRMMMGEYLPLADGRVERIYDVFYRTLADTPGEELGGSRRRYREVWDGSAPDTLRHTLEWWHEGRWQPWARGEYTLVRRKPAG